MTRLRALLSTKATLPSANRFSGLRGAPRRGRGHRSMALATEELRRYTRVQAAESGGAVAGNWSVKRGFRGVLTELCGGSLNACCNEEIGGAVPGLLHRDSVGEDS